MDELFGPEEEESEMIVEQKQDPAVSSAATAEVDDLFGSDNDDDANADTHADTNNPEAAAKDEQEELFGSDDDNENKDRDNGNNSPSDAKREAEDLDGLFGSDDEAAAAPAVKVRTQSELSLPVLKKTLQPGGFVVAATMPSFVKIQAHPYVPGEIPEEEEVEQFMGAIDMVRWRFKRDEVTGSILCDSSGKPMRESNARMVKWSDGSFQLVVGSTVFDAEMVPVHDR